MTQAQAVKETIRNLGGVATLKDIYKHIHKIKDCHWASKTPDASIRRIVQQNPDIIRLTAGHYMLAEFRDKMICEQTSDKMVIIQQNTTNQYNIGCSVNNNIQS